MNLSNEQLVEITTYYFKPHSLRDTAKYFNLDRTTLKHFLLKNGIKLHDKSVFDNINREKKLAYYAEKPEETIDKYIDVINKILEYFGTKDELNNYWHTHSRREIDKFVQKTFNISYFIFKRIMLEYFNFTNRTHHEITRLNRIHSRETNLKRYGMEHAPNKIYTADNIYFDSVPELAVYLYAKAHNELIERCPVKLLYIWEGKEYAYFPDFRYKNELIEIKGKQFVNPDGTWQNPFDHNYDGQFEAKRQCAIANNVKIFYEKDYLYFVNWFNKRYKKDQFLAK